MYASMRRKVTGAALAALLLSGGAVACGTETGSDSAKEESPKMTPAAAVAKAAKNVEDITSLSYRMTGEVPEEGRIEAEAQMSMKPTVAMSMKMTALDQAEANEVEIRLVDKAMYLDGGAEAAKEMDGKRWIKFDMDALGKDAGALGGESLGATADKNPAQESTLLTGSKDVKEVGAETIDGVETTHYQGTVTLDQFRKSLKGEDKATREQREKAIEQYEDMGLDSLTMHMWIDDEDHTKQFRMKGDADKGPLDMTITFLDYNKPVTVEAPPAKDTMDLAEMMEAAQQG
ncbi:LppX_LprAFG lipoprotein [Streptomyces bluensis]